MAKKIYIDPGHSSKDPGAVGFVVERDLNEKTAQYMNEYLQANYECETKVCPISIDSLKTIASEANSWGADLFVSIHNNAGKGDGWEGLVYASNRKSMGQIFEKYIVAAGQNSRGVKYRPELTVLDATNMPAIINEGAFVDNQNDIKDWDEDAELKKLGEAYAKAAAEYLALPKKAVAPSTPTPTPTPVEPAKQGRYASTLLNIALAEEGYLEKKSNSNLDSKTANAGYNNYTKYARDLDALGYFYNGPKNGYAWCDVFVDWCFVQAFGPEGAMDLLEQPQKSYGAGCYYSAKYYKDKGLYHTSNPKPGDQVFFWNSSRSELAHTGLVYAVDGTYVYTIEGNTSSASGVEANGGGVFRKKYQLNYNRLAGYGRPQYDVEGSAGSGSSSTSTSTTYKPTVKEWQLAAIADGFKFPKYGADGEWGSECAGVATNAIVKKRSTYMYPNLTTIVQKVVGVEADGKCGKDTDAAIKKYQYLNGLEDDGEVGLNTWKKILGV